VLGIAANDGFAAGVNRAAAQAHGEYLLLVNPDTVCEPALVAVLKDWLDAHPRVAVAGPRILNEDGSVQASARRFPDATTAMAGRTTFLTRWLPGNPLTRRNLGYSVGSEPRTVDWVTGACAMVRASAFHAVGGMDTRFFLYWEDADFCRRLLDAGWQTAYVPTVSAVHVGGRASRHDRLKALMAFHRSAYRYYRKHGGRAAALTAPLVWSGLWIRAGLKAAALVVRGRS
jgi:GT2 family glycosyltransferase